MANGDSPVTLREVYTLIEGVRDKIEAGFKAHDTEHTAHDLKHDAEHRSMVSLVRWAVTTVLSAGGIAVAIWVGVKG